MASEAGTQVEPGRALCMSSLASCEILASKPKAAMTVERMFELITDCLVFICFSCLGLVSVLVFRRVYCLCRFTVHKRKGRLKPATTAHFFDRLQPCCENILDRGRVCGVEQPS